MSTTKRWPVNPPSDRGGELPDDEPVGPPADQGGEPPDDEPVGPPDPLDGTMPQLDPATRVALAQAAARERRWGRRADRGDEPDLNALRYSPILWVSVIALLVLALSGLIIWQGLRNPPPPPMAIPAGVTDDGGRQSGLAVAGNGPTTVEVYFDLLCAQCRAVDALTWPLLSQLADQDRIRLVWHPMSLLDNRTRPPGYSTRAANALACAADAGKLREFADVLFLNQPATESAGLSDDQLVEGAGTVGIINPAFAACVRDMRYLDWLNQAQTAAAERGIAQTPAIFVNGGRLTQFTPQTILAAVG